MISRLCFAASACANCGTGPPKCAPISSPTSCSPAASSSLEGKLTLHIRERLPNGQLLGIFIDDQRDPKERVDLPRRAGRYPQEPTAAPILLLADRQRAAAAGRRTRSHHRAVRPLRLRSVAALRRSRRTLSNIRARERYLWELFDPDPDDPPSPSSPDQIRAELHDRITAPLYPLAFVVMAFAYLGAPRTTRQSRTLSLIAAIGAVAVLRGVGFVGTLAGAHTPAALLSPYVAADRGLSVSAIGDLARRHHRAAGLHRRRDQPPSSSGLARGAAPCDGASPMIAGTLSRYFGLRFLNAVLAVFVGAMALVAMVDFIEMLRRTGDMKDVSTLLVAKITIFRVPFITERIMPFAVLVGAMSCYLEPVAPARTGGRARGRHFGLAIHRARPSSSRC